MNFGLARFISRQLNSHRARCLALPFVIGVTVFCARQASAQTNWNVTTGDFNVASNWTNGIPNATTNAIVSNNGTCSVTSNGTTLECNAGTIGSQTGTYTVTGASTVLTVSSNMRLGTAAGATGTLNVNSGTVNVAGATLNIAETSSTATGNLNVAGGTFNANGATVLAVGRVGNGNLTISSGTFNNNSTAGFASVGLASGGTGIMTVSGGTYLNNTATVQSLNVSDQTGSNGTLTVNSGLVNLKTGILFVGKTSGATGVANLNGGIVNTASVTGGAGTGTINFNGGVLRASAASTTFVSGVTNANVNSGGAIIDSDVAITIPQILKVNVASPGGGLQKTGNGTLILSAADTYTGPTTFTGGTLQVGNGTTGSIDPTSTLQPNGGTFLLQGKTTGTTSQTVNGLNVLAGNSTVSAATNGGTGTTLALGAITRTVPGGVVNFTLPTTGSVTTTTGNTNGIISGGATVGGTAPATNSSGNVIALATANFGNSYATATSATNFDPLGVSGTFTNNAVNSIRFNNAAAVTSTLNGNYSIGSGLILVTSTVAANATTITGGTNLTSGNGTDLIVTQNNTGALTIASNITGAIGLTKSGVGSLTLTGANDYTGVTTVNGGANSELVAGSSTALGTTSSGTTITADGARVVLANGVTITGKPISVFGSGSNGRGALQAATNATGTWAGTISLNNIPSGTSARIGAQDGGTLILNGPVVNGTVTGLDISAQALATGGGVILNAPNTYTGPTSIIRGNLVVDGTSGGAVSTGADITVASSGSSEYGSLTVRNNGSVATSTNLLVGQGAGSPGALALSSGSISAAGNLFVANNTAAAGSKLSVDGGTLTGNVLRFSGVTAGTSSFSTVAQTAGTINSNTYYTLGYSGNGTATDTMTGGTRNIRTNSAATAGELEVGVFDGVISTLTQSGASAINLDNNSNLAVGSQNSSAANTFNQNAGTVTFYGDNGITVGGTGSLILGRGTASGTNTYNLNGGTLTVPKITRTTSNSGTNSKGIFNFNGGTLKATATNAAFISALTAANVQANGATIDTNGFTETLGQALVHGTTTPDGGLTKNSAGTLILTGVNTYDGPTAINAGTLQIGTSTVSGSLGSGNYAKVISGGGSLVKASIAAQSLSAANTYTGSTAINLGTLTLDHSGSNAGALGETATTVAAGATLLVKGSTNIGTTTGSLAVAGGTATQGTLDLRDNTINTLSIGGNFATGDANGGSSLYFDIGASNGANDQINVVNGTVIATGTTTVNLKALTNVVSGNYILINAPNGGLTAGGAGFATGTTPPGFNTYSFANSTATQLVLTITAAPTPSTAYWTGLASATVGDTSNNWGTGSALATPQSNWSSTKNGLTDTLQVPGSTTDTYFTADNATANAGVLNTQLDGSYTIKSLTFDTSAVTAITSVGINTNGNSLTFGTGGLQVATANTSATTISGATGSVVLNANQNWANNSNTTVLTVAPGVSAFSGATTLNLNGTGTGGVVLGGTIANGTGTSLGLTFNQAGVTQVNGTNTYTGGTVINSGTVQTSNAASLGTLPAASVAFGAGSTGILQLNGTALSVSDLNTDANVGTPIVQNNGTANSVLTVNTANTDTFGGVLQNGVGAGTFALTKAGAGKLTLSGTNTYTGGATLTAGTVNVASAQNGTTSGPLGASGTITFGNGILQYSPANQFDYSPRFAATANQAIGIDTNGQDVTYASNITTATGSLSKSGTGNLTLGGATSTMADLFGRGGTLTFPTGSGLTTTAYSSIGQLAGDNSTMNVNGTSNVTVGGDLNIADTTGTIGVLNMNGTGLVKGNILYIGKSGTANGTVNQTSGTVQSVAGDARIGGSGSAADASAIGAYNLSGGTLNLGGNFQVGGYGKGTLTQTGGTTNVTAGFPSIGRYPGGIGIVNLTAGAFNQSGAGQRLLVGEQGTGTFTVGDGTSANTTATVTAVGGLTAGNNTGGVGTFNLNKGGTLNTAFVQQLTGTGTFNFNGGTLRSSAASTTFVSALTTNVGTGGAIIDTNTFADTVATNLVGGAGDGGVTKNGTGVLTLAGTDTYTGGNTINGGTLSGTTASLVGNTLATTGTILDFTQTTTGTYAGLVSGAGSLTKNGTGVVTLSGANTYTGTTTLGAGTLSVSSLANGGSPSNIGQSSNAAANLLFNGGTLQYTGATASTDRAFTIAAAGTANIDVPTSTTNLTISGSIPATTGGVTKTGNVLTTGTLTLSGTNAFTGGVTIGAGNLIATNSSSLGTGTKTITIANGTNGNPQLHLNGSAGNIDLPASFTYSTSNAAGTFVNDAGTNSIAGQINIITGGGGATFQSNTGNLTVSANITAAATGRSVIVQGASNGSITGIISDGLTTGLPLTKNGAGTWTLSGANTYTGLTTISGGTLALGASERLADTSNMALSGGTFSTGGFSETLGTLSLPASSSLDFGAGTSTVSYSGVGTFATGATLTLSNYTSGSDHLFFVNGGNAVTLTATQLGQIKFLAPNGQSGTYSASQLGSGEVVPVGLNSASSGALLGEFRAHGSSGATDEYIELANSTTSALDISGWSVKYLSGGTLVTATVPNGTSLVALGHYLFTGSGYNATLSGISGSDQSLASPMDDATGITLLNAGASVVDSVSFAGSSMAGEGTLLPSAPTADGEYAFERRQSSGNPAGVPLDNNNNSGDFIFVSTTGSTFASITGDGTATTLDSTLGSPSPNSTTGYVQTGSVALSLLDTSVANTLSPNRVRLNAVDSGVVGAPDRFGTLRLRRTLTNNGSTTYTRVRFHVVTITTLNGGGYNDLNQADVRLLTSPDETGIATSTGAKNVIGTSVQAPATGTVGGGLNANTVVLNQALTPGSSANYSFELGVARKGNFLVGFTIELLP